MLDTSNKDGVLAVLRVAVPAWTLLGVSATGWSGYAECGALVFCWYNKQERVPYGIILREVPVLTPHKALWHIQCERMIIAKGRDQFDLKRALLVFKAIGKIRSI